MLNKIILTLLFGFSTMTFAEGLPPLTHKLNKLPTPITAPSLNINNMDDEKVKLKKGQVTIVNFWATWCPPCRREMGSLERLHQATKNHGVRIIAVNIGEDEDTIFSFLGTVDPSPSFEMALDLDAKTMDTWHVKGLPTTYIINQQGNIVYQAIGGREFDHPNIINAVIQLSNE